MERYRFLWAVAVVLQSVEVRAHAEAAAHRAQRRTVLVALLHLLPEERRAWRVEEALGLRDSSRRLCIPR